MQKKSIRFSLNKMVIISLLSLGIIILAVSIPLIYNAIVSETEDGLKNLSHALLEQCNRIGEGDYSIEDGVLCKGGTPVSDGNEIVDKVKEVSGIDATICWNDTRMITTVCKENGERAIGTKSSDEVVTKVLKEGKEYFSSKVLVDNQYYYGYYVPVKNSDGTVVGMVFVGKSRGKVIETIFHVALRVSLVVVIVTAVALAISLHYADGIIKSLSKVRGFLENITQGDMACELEPEILERQDEIGEMGQFAQMLQKSVVKLIGTDPLTGLYNRRSCNEVLEKAINEYRENGKRCAVAIGDIDNFKKLNDNYGHLAGDEVLKVLSDIFQEHMQGKGSAFRWGGEEFLLIYQSENPIDEVKETEALLEKVRTTLISYKDQTIQVTMTFGVSICRTDDTEETVIKRADEGMYMGKSNGKNQVVF